MTDLQKQLKEFSDHVLNDFVGIDGVQIFVQGRAKNGDTVSYETGSGSVYAREGHVREWLTVVDARATRYGADNTYTDGR